MATLWTLKAKMEAQYMDMARYFPIAPARIVMFQSQYPSLTLILLGDRLRVDRVAVVHDSTEVWGLRILL